MAILTDSGRAAVAASVKSQALHMAWGSGNEAWDTAPVPESMSDAALVAEVGRRKVTQAMFCIPDAAGEIVVPNGRFTVSEAPTKYLYMRYAFDFTDSPTAVIREVGVFVGTVAKSTVPAGQDYLLPADIESPGQLLALEHVARIDRSSSVRQQFEFVIQF